MYIASKKLTDFMKIKSGDNIKKIYYFSDGSVAKYKNKKNFTNLCFHKDDLAVMLNGISRQWHMGKGHVMVLVQLWKG